MPDSCSPCDRSLDLRVRSHLRVAAHVEADLHELMEGLEAAVTKQYLIGETHPTSLKIYHISLPVTNILSDNMVNFNGEGGSALSRFGAAAQGLEAASASHTTCTITQSRFAWLPRNSMRGLLHTWWPVGLNSWGEIWPNHRASDISDGYDLSEVIYGAANKLSYSTTNAGRASRRSNMDNSFNHNRTEVPRMTLQGEVRTNCRSASSVPNKEIPGSD